MICLVLCSVRNVKQQLDWLEAHCQLVQVETLKACTVASAVASSFLCSGIWPQASSIYASVPPVELHPKQLLGFLIECSDPGSHCSLFAV